MSDNTQKSILRGILDELQERHDKEATRESRDGFSIGLCLGLADAIGLVKEALFHE